MSELDRLEAAMGECREMIREAHAATKDLRAAVREARQELRALARDEVAAQVQLEVSRQLEELGERTGQAVLVLIGVGVGYRDAGAGCRTACPASVPRAARMARASSAGRSPWTKSPGLR